MLKRIRNIALLILAVTVTGYAVLIFKARQKTSSIVQQALVSGRMKLQLQES